MNLLAVDNFQEETLKLNVNLFELFFLYQKVVYYDVLKFLRNVLFHRECYTQNLTEYLYCAE